MSVSTDCAGHVVVSGNRLLGYVRWGLIRYGRHGISRDQLYEWNTSRPITCLSVGFRHDSGLPEPAPKNGVIYPESCWLKASLTQDGSETPLRELGIGYEDHGKEYHQIWMVPANITNIVGAELHLTRNHDGQDVAFVQLR
jgi:hypothetical protein